MQRTDEELNRRASTPQYWFNKSTDLRAAAGALWYCMDQTRNQLVTHDLTLGDGFSMAAATRPVYLMLCGLSLELVYKAILVTLGKEPPARHDLCQLSAAAGIAITPQQKQLLSLLTESIYWAGRYPTPASNRHKAIDDLATIYRELVYDQRALGASSVLHTKDPDPLGWQAFNLVWNAGSTTFFEHLHAHQTRVENV